MDDGNEVEARIKWVTGGTQDKAFYNVVIDPESCVKNILHLAQTKVKCL
jgi:hypothetical protein